MANLFNTMLFSSGLPSAGKVLQLKAATTNVIKAYQTVTPTGTGTSGNSSFTASADCTTIIPVGAILTLGSDSYTVTSVSTVTIGVTPNLITSYAAQPIALDKVSQWSDLSGQGNHYTQGTTAVQPIYNPLIINSTRPGISFVGAHNLIAPSGLYSIPNGDNTLFTVAYRATESGSQAYVFALTKAGSARYHFRFAGTAGNTAFWNSNAAPGTEVTRTGGTSTIPLISTSQRSGTTLQLQINNGTAGTNSNANSEAGIDAGSLGSFLGTTAFLNGSIAEVILYNRALSAAENVQVCRILANEHAITIS